MISNNTPRQIINRLITEKCYEEAVEKVYELAGESMPEYGVKIHHPEDALSVAKLISNKRKEHFLAIYLDTAHKVIGYEIISVGLLNRTLVHPREVFAPAILLRAAAIIVCHNHPAGDVTPSNEDREITRRLKDAGGILGVNVLDHIIVSPRSKGELKHYSFLANNDL